MFAAKLAVNPVDSAFVGSAVVGFVVVVACFFVDSVVLTCSMFSVVVSVISEGGIIEVSFIVCSSVAVLWAGVIVGAVDSVVDSDLLVSSVVTLSDVVAPCVVDSVVVFTSTVIILVGGTVVVDGVFSVVVDNLAAVVGAMVVINIVDSVVGSIVIVARVVESVVVVTSLFDMIVGVFWFSSVVFNASGVVLVTRIIVDAVDSPVGSSVGIRACVVKSHLVVASIV